MVAYYEHICSVEREGGSRAVHVVRIEDEMQAHRWGSENKKFAPMSEEKAAFVALLESQGLITALIHSQFYIPKEMWPWPLQT